MLNNSQADSQEPRPEVATTGTKNIEFLEKINYFNDERKKNTASTYFVYCKRKEPAIRKRSLLRPTTDLPFYSLCSWSEKRLKVENDQGLSDVFEQLECKTNNTSSEPVEEPKITKDEFFKLLNLIPLEKHDEIVNKRSVRKQRTTANPHFSSAALEAKRASKRELLEMRKNKRLEKERAQCKNNENKFPANKEAEFTKYKKLVTEDITNIPKFLLVKRTPNLKHCKICSEPCRCNLDTTVQCKTCLSFFHFNCLSGRCTTEDVFCVHCSSYFTEGHLPFVERDNCRNKLNYLHKLIINGNQNVAVLREFYKNRVAHRSKLLDDKKRLSRRIQRIQTLISSVQCENGEEEEEEESSCSQDNTSNETNHISGSDTSSNLDYYESANLYQQTALQCATSSACDNENLPVVTFCA